MAQHKSPDDVRHDFEEVVNMTPKQLENWLETDESKAVGWGGEGGESIGHESGRRIVAIKRKRTYDLDEDDLTHMRKVAGYVRRHRRTTASPRVGSRASSSLGRRSCRWRERSTVVSAAARSAPTPDREPELAGSLIGARAFAVVMGGPLVLLVAAVASAACQFARAQPPLVAAATSGRGRRGDCRLRVALFDRR
jgi:hypothetical protein